MSKCYIIKNSNLKRPSNNYFENIIPNDALYLLSIYIINAVYAINMFLE